LPANIPSSIECDVSDLDLEQTVAVRDLVLSEGVEVSLPPAQTIGGVYGKRKVEEDTEATAEGAAAPAAADAKKPDKK
jgi:large subunit ribosomal protein L25